MSQDIRNHSQYFLISLFIIFFLFGSAGWCLAEEQSDNPWNTQTEKGKEEQAANPWSAQAESGEDTKPANPWSYQPASDEASSSSNSWNSPPESEKKTSWLDA